MGVVDLRGAVVAGPPGSSSSAFPSAIFTDTLKTDASGSPRSFNAAAASPGRLVTSPSAFLPLPDIGASGDVTKADWLYLCADSPIDVQFTQDDGAGSTTVNVLYGVMGTLIVPFSAPKYLVGLAVKGSARVVFLATGPS